MLLVTRGAALVLLLGTAAGAIGCGGRDRSNPLDPGNPLTGGRLPGLVALAGHAQVSIRWDPLVYQDHPRVEITRFTTGREAGYGPVPLVIPLDSVSFPAVALESGAFLDTTALDGWIYRYELRLRAGSGAVASVSSLEAGPGAAVCWVVEIARERLVALAPDAGSARAARSELYSPRSLSLVSDGAGYWVADALLEGVARLDTLGRLLESYPVFANPSLVLADPLEGGCFVADDFGGRVGLVTAVGALSWEASEFAGVTSLAFDPLDGGVWVVEPDANRVTRVRRGGARAFTVHGFNNPQQVVVSPAGVAGRSAAVWVSDAGSGTLVRLTPEGREIARYGPFPGIRALALDGRTGEVWLGYGGARSDGGTGHIVRLDPEAGIQLDVAAPYDPVALALESRNGACWVADARGGAVWRIPRFGMPLRHLEGLAFPASLQVEPGPRSLPDSTGILQHPGRLSRTGPPPRN